MNAVLKRINAFNSGLPPNLREIKKKALLESPFRFFRGTDHLFAEDFIKLYNYGSKVKTWVCGDLHFENFGSFKGENRLVYFDLNDFDEAILASPEIDVSRFLASVIVAAGMMKAQGLSINKTVHDIVSQYVNTVNHRKALMLEAEVAHGVFKKYFEQLGSRNRAEYIAEKTTKVKGQLALKIDQEHFLEMELDLKGRIIETMQSYVAQHKALEHLVFSDVAFRVAGTGSLGLQRYCILGYNKRKGKHYLLDMKEGRHSCFSELIDTKQPKFKNQAERIITIGNLMEFSSPAFTVPVFFDDKWFIVKELQPYIDKISLAELKTDFKTLSEVAVEMASLAAYAHLRSSGHLGASSADDLVKFVNKKQWQTDIVEVSYELARKNNKYYHDYVNYHTEG